MPEPFSNGSTAVATLQKLKEEVTGERKAVRTVVLLAGPCMHCKLAHTSLKLQKKIHLVKEHFVLL